MKSLRILLASVCAFSSLSILTGCESFPHYLKPEQLQKLNRGPALGRDTYNFSVPPQNFEPISEDNLIEPLN